MPNLKHKHKFWGQTLQIPTHPQMNSVLMRMCGGLPELQWPTRKLGTVISTSHSLKSFYETIYVKLLASTSSSLKLNLPHFSFPGDIGAMNQISQETSLEKTGKEVKEMKKSLRTGVAWNLPRARHSAACCPSASPANPQPYAMERPLLSAIFWKESLKQAYQPLH